MQSLVFQVAQVNKALGSISYLVDHGYRVIFDQDLKTGKDISMMVRKDSKTVIRFRRDRNIWVLDAFIDIDKLDEDFQRHA